MWKGFRNFICKYFILTKYLQMLSSEGSKSSNEHSCESCNYHTSRLSQFTRHLLTAKHKMFTNTADLEPNTSQKVPKTFDCVCGKTYSHRQSLYNHKQKCDFTPPVLENSVVEPNDMSKIGIVCSVNWWI